LAVIDEESGRFPCGNGSGDVIIERRLKDSMNMMLLEAAAKTKGVNSIPRRGN
jgi:hypothetical protein